MKQIQLVICFILICCNCIQAQINTQHRCKVDTNFINYITQNVSETLGRSHIFPITIICNGEKHRVIIENGYFYNCLNKKYNFSKEEYIEYIRKALKNDDAIPFCLDERIKTENNSRIELIEIKEKDRKSINLYEIDELLKNAFTEDRILKGTISRKYIGFIVETLYENKITLSFACEIGGGYFYNKYDPELDFLPIKKE